MLGTWTITVPSSFNTLCKFLTCILSSKLHEWFFIQKGRIFDDGGSMTKIDTIIKFPIFC